MVVGTMARRLVLRLWSRVIRRAGIGLCLCLAFPFGQSLAAEGMGASDFRHRPPPLIWPAEVLAAEFIGPTTRYGHAILGDAVEWSALMIHFSDPGLPSSDAPISVEISLAQDHVFEDLKPRLVDLDLNGHPDAAMVVETDMALGAALALYGVDGKIAETPHIGRSHRWLAPIGAADFDGDGHVEIAYIDRPHLAKTLRIWRFKAGKLREVAAKTGLTNHRIGQDFITSGLRVCSEGVELVTVDADWQWLVASRLVEGQIQSRNIGAFSGADSLRAALNCS